MGTLAERVAEAINDAGCSITELAIAAGVKSPSVSDWLNGKTRTLKSAPALRAAKFLKVEVLWLTEGKGQKHPEQWSLTPSGELTATRHPDDVQLDDALPTSEGVVIDPVLADLAELPPLEAAYLRSLIATAAARVRMEKAQAKKQPTSQLDNHGDGEKKTKAA